MALDSEFRVFAGNGTVPAPCMWFAQCVNLANGLRTGPVGNGEVGNIPICKRCDDKCERLSS